ncbi:rRNA-processing protein las1 [Rhinocladiella similis]
MVSQFPPWRHTSELAMVRDWFFPDRAKQDAFSTTPQDMKQRAIDKVNLWVFKAGQLPPAIVATSGLTEALLHDDPNRRSRGISDPAMQSIYAMAFARFVNGFVDRDVARLHTMELALDDSETEDAAVLPAKGESSMYAHATAIGMPQKFVDLRHQVTHGDIPNLFYLRQMTQHALTWLWEKWWVKHVEGDSGQALRELEERKRVARGANDAEIGQAESNDDDKDGTTISYAVGVGQGEYAPYLRTMPNAFREQTRADSNKRKRDLVDSNDTK